MTKTILKVIGLFVFLLAVAAISWLTSYYVTLRVNESSATNQDQLTETVEAFAEDKTSNYSKSVPIDYYIVRLEGDALNIYTCMDNSEEFLYSENIVTSNLTKTDIEMLSRGTVLYTTSQLTEFMENFVS